MKTAYIINPYTGRCEAIETNDDTYEDIVKELGRPLSGRLVDIVDEYRTTLYVFYNDLALNNTVHRYGLLHSSGEGIPGVVMIFGKNHDEEGDQVGLTDDEVKLIEQHIGMIGDPAHPVLVLDRKLNNLIQRRNENEQQRRETE